MRYQSSYDKSQETNEVEYSEVATDEKEDNSVEPIAVEKAGLLHNSGSMTLEDTERETIRLSLERNGGKRRRAAEELNISERTLYRKIKEYGLD